MTSSEIPTQRVGARMKRSSTHLAGTVVLVAAIALGGCGGDDEPQPQPQGGTNSAAEQITVTETDFELHPAKAEVEQAG